MKTVDILIAVDGDKIVSQVQDGKLGKGSVNAPTNLGAYGSSDVFISMIAQNSSATNNQGQSELTIKANSGSIVQWTITTFDNNVNYTAYLYNGSFSPSTAISSLDYDAVTSVNYLPSQGNPTGPVSKVNNHLYVSSGKLLTPGVKIQYTLSFALIDNENGNTIGWFTWDPFIQVNG